MQKTITLPVRDVVKIGDVYFVRELQADGTHKRLGKEYQHQTSAYAALGRLTEEAGKE